MRAQPPRHVRAERLEQGGPPDGRDDDLDERAAHLFLSDEEAEVMRRCTIEHRALHFWCAKEAAWKQRSSEFATLRQLPLTLVNQREDGLDFDAATTRKHDNLIAALGTLQAPFSAQTTAETQPAPDRRTAEDVVEAVQFAARHGLRVTPQATGHGPMAALTTELLVTTKELTGAALGLVQRYGAAIQRLL